MGEGGPGKKRVQSGRSKTVPLLILFILKHMLKATEGFRLNIKVGCQVFLRHSLQKLRALLNKIQEPFARGKPRHDDLPFVVHDHGKRNDQPSQSFHLGMGGIYFFQIIVGHGN